MTYHVHGLRLAQQDVANPDSLPRYFTRQGFRWLLQRRRSDQERQESAHFHREALVRLGYFERREFKVERDLSSGGDADKKFTIMRTRLPLSCTLWQNQFCMTQGTTFVTVCARTCDMKLWEKLFAEFNEKEDKIE